MKILGIITGWSSNKYRELHDAYGGVDYYRIVKPLDTIGQEYIGKKITKFPNYDEVVKGYDIVVTKPVLNVAGFKLLYACKQAGVKLVIDLDDNPFESRINQDSYETLKPGSEGRAFVGANLSLADAIICSTVPLKEYIEDWLEKVHKVKVPIYLSPNYIDPKDFNFKKAEKKNDKITIGYPGSTSHNDDLKYVMPALVEILKKNKNVEVELVGSIDQKKKDIAFEGMDTSKELFDRIFISPGTLAFDNYPLMLSTKTWDIGIAPLINDEFNRNKSHIKWMEYAMYKIPCVASNVYPYVEPIEGKDTIKHMKTGLIARSKREWVKYLQLLIDNENLRKRIGENAYEYVTKNWTWDKEKINSIYEDIQKLPTKSINDYIK